MVRNVAEAVALPELDERQIKIGLEIPGLAKRTDVAIVNAGFLMSEDGPGVDRPPPAYGEHTEEMLASLGWPFRVRAPDELRDSLRKVAEVVSAAAG